jgi:hypothetical protein
MGVLTGCKSRKEVLKGDLQDAIFAADFGDLVAGRAPAVYGEAKTFFQNTPSWRSGTWPTTSATRRRGRTSCPRPAGQEP